MTANQKDIELLHSNPGELVVKYQTIINIIIQKTLIAPGFYPLQEKEELCQDVSLRLLEKTDEIKKQYNVNRSLFITFFSLKVDNFCYDILRKKKKKPAIDPLPEEISIPSTGKHETEKEIYLLDECKKFEVILKLYYRKRAKVELCLQIIYRIPVLLFYFVNYCKKTSKAFYSAVMKLLPLNKEFSNKEIFHIITPYLNKSEHTDNTDDAIQRWMHNIINDSIKQMNVGNDAEIYDKEMFQVLVEKYYDLKKRIKKIPFFMV